MLAMFFLLHRTQVMILLVSFGALYVFVCPHAHDLD